LIDKLDKTQQVKSTIDKVAETIGFYF